jgi:hypothetical protein
MGETSHWIELGLTILVQLVAAGYVYGKLSATISTHGERLSAMDEEQDRHWSQIGEHGSASRKSKAPSATAAIEHLRTIHRPLAERCGRSAGRRLLRQG